jgi:hypothetical protein
MKLKIFTSSMIIKSFITIILALTLLVSIICSETVVTESSKVSLQNLNNKFQNKIKNKLRMKVPNPGEYNGDCLRDLPGPPVCTDKRTRCADLNGIMKCYLGNWQRCDKSEDFDTTCADKDFRCINYKIKDSSNKEVALCAPKGSYFDTCSATNVCANGFKCTQITYGNKKENRCLVDKGFSCEDVKLCATGLFCDAGLNKCEECDPGRSLLFKSYQGFYKALTNSPTCDSIKLGSD